MATGQKIIHAGLIANICLRKKHNGDIGLFPLQELSQPFHRLGYARVGGIVRIKGEENLPVIQSDAMKSEDTVIPPRLFFALQFQTPVMSITHSPCEANASAFFTPSVIQRGTEGS